LVALSFWALGAHASPLVDLGTADFFAVLAGSTVTNTGPSVIHGDLGVSPGSAITGFPPGMVSDGTIHGPDATTVQAQNDLTTAYNAAAGEPCMTNLSGTDLGGLTLTPGVYCFDSSAQLTGTLDLDAEGNTDAQFLFQIGSTLTTASDASVDFIDGGQDGRVFWQVGSSATLGTTTAFVGDIMALTSITLTTGADIQCGGALARNGAVTLDTNNVAIDTANCETTTAATGGGSGSIPVPEPGTAALLGAGLFLSLVARRRPMRTPRALLSRSL